MTQSANVHSLEAIHDFRTAIIVFGDDVATAIEELRLQVQRALQWIDDECATYWRQETRNCFNRVAEARAHLERRRRAAYSARVAACIDEKLALQKAKRELEAAVAMQKTVRQWSIKLHRAADLFKTRLSRCEHVVSNDVPKLLALLDRMLTALDEYIAIKPAANTPMRANHVEAKQ